MTKTEKTTIQAKTLLEGKTIIEVRAMTHDEQSEKNWICGAIVMIFDDGSKVYATGGPAGPASLTVEGKNEETEIGIIY
tara:strand:- start:862 stop:1098 length:237 start_codon:yes stop_codon:yes gene_type:complete